MLDFFPEVLVQIARTLYVLEIPGTSAILALNMSQISLEFAMRENEHVREIPGLSQRWPPRHTWALPVGVAALISNYRFQVRSDTLQSRLASQISYARHIYGKRDA